jgi:glycosyltransferase involved in cell wall biosynthesis
VIFALDMQSTLARRSGVGRYAWELARHLPSSLNPGEELVLPFFDFSRRGGGLQVPGACARPCRWLPGRLAQAAWKRIGWPPYDWLFGRADLYHFPNFVRPPLRRGRSVVTIHDISFLRHPETLETRNLAYLRASIRATLDRVDAVITDCHTIAEEIQAEFQYPAARLHPIWLGISPDCRRADAAAVQGFRQRHHLDRPYLLHVGTLEPRKNHAFLLEVFDRLTDFDGDLVLAGMPGWKFEPILARIAASPRRARIRHLDFVDDADLRALYSGAEALLFPSLYEGFGLPPLEAMRCDTPVISAPGGSLREVMGTGAEVLPVDDSEPWVAATRRLLGDSAARAARVAAGRDWVARFDWVDTARRTLDLYRSLTR